ncbi:TauD/TfdA dioxygenase family protein [Vineibacter terrae]|uniref:TauD/TfdA dioxygenase family protein n=1 Tax=Vineibacter terrae TaxID=2586908 RepID=UPI002E362BD1|nr:TauD/TfdA family dioxygenase [Vineibacter terrae]HEX2890467.1 TauD/TfdA family dioxygenase [Vineibacter terrae]
MVDQRLEVERIAGACGAQVTGVDLAGPLEPEIVAQIRAAILEHQVLTFPGQSIDDAGLERFTAYFGPFGVEPFVEGEETHPHVISVIKEADERRTANFGGNWHSDWSFQERPPSFTLLHARDLPPVGGDTMFANQYLAWEALSAGMRRTLESLRAVHSARRPYGPQGTYADRRKARSMKIQAGEAALAEMVHPVARVHAETGRTALYVNRVYTIRFEDMTERESAPLLDYLYDHSVRPEFTCRIRWAPHALTMWDNRAVQHFAVNDYDGFRRELHRTTNAGERPLSPAEACQAQAAQ